jgi:hypothetical protein
LWRVKFIEYKTGLGLVDIVFKFNVAVVIRVIAQQQKWEARKQGGDDRRDALLLCCSRGAISLLKNIK